MFNNAQAAKKVSFALTFWLGTKTYAAPSLLHPCLWSLLVTCDLELAAFENLL